MSADSKSIVLQQQTLLLATNISNNKHMHADGVLFACRHENHFGYKKQQTTDSCMYDEINN